MKRSGEGEARTGKGREVVLMSYPFDRIEQDSHFQFTFLVILTSNYCKYVKIVRHLLLAVCHVT